MPTLKNDFKKQHLNSINILIQAINKFKNLVKESSFNHCLKPETFLIPKIFYSLI